MNLTTEGHRIHSKNTSVADIVALCNAELVRHSPNSIPPSVTCPPDITSPGDERIMEALRILGERGIHATASYDTNPVQGGRGLSRVVEIVLSLLSELEGDLLVRIKLPQRPQV